MLETNANRDNRNTNKLWAWDDLVRFQLNIANRWLERGDGAKDIFAKFFFYFAGFNAMYFLWRKIDGLSETNEGKHIENLLRRFSENKAQEILSRIKTSVTYFEERRPIQRMDRRTIHSQYNGEETQGLGLKKRLRDNKLPASERLVAMGQILYLVRCNLVHGSKEDAGDDLEVIQACIEPLKVLLKEAISSTKYQCSQWRNG